MEESQIWAATSMSRSTTSTSSALDRFQVHSPVDWSREVRLVASTKTPKMIPDLSMSDKRLLHYWVEQLSSLISVTPRGTESNPYQLHLTAMVYSPGALRSTVLSMAAQHLALVTNDEILRFDAYRHQGDAIRQLQLLLQTPHEASAEPALASVLMMQVSTRLFGDGDAEPQAANHLVGARAMLAQRREGLTAWKSLPGPRFLLSLFAYHDILSSVSRSSRPLIDHGQDFDAIEGVSSMKGIASVLHVVAAISELQDLPKLGGSRDHFEATASRLEQALKHLDPSPPSISGEVQSTDITLTAKAYRHAAFIYLYRVWLGIGAPSPITLHHVQQCLLNLSQVSVLSPLVSSHIWPLFTAGCEAIHEEERQFVRDRFASMFCSLKFPVMKRILTDIKAVWDCKDLEAVLGGHDGMAKVDCIQVIRRQRGREVSLA